jgi:predicted transcriptional regulator
MTSFSEVANENLEEIDKFKCPICIEEFNKKDVTYVTFNCCNNPMCHGCYMDYYHKQNEIKEKICPLCRQSNEAGNELVEYQNSEIKQIKEDCKETTVKISEVWNDLYKIWEGIKDNDESNLDQKEIIMKQLWVLKGINERIIEMFRNRKQT